MVYHCVVLNEFLCHELFKSYIFHTVIDEIIEFGDDDQYNEIEDDVYDVLSWTDDTHWCYFDDQCAKEL